MGCTVKLFDRVRHGQAWLVLVVLTVLLGCKDRTPSTEARSRGRSEQRSSANSPERTPAAAALVTLKAHHRLGVPLHPEKGSNGVSGRLPDGARVRITERAEKGRWLHVQAEDGTSGWITRRYLASPEPSAAPAAPSSGVSSGNAACQRRLRSRPPRRAGVARIGSWNVAWFPDGRPGKQRAAAGTDIGWLACTIAELGVDVLAVQEFKAHPAARAALGELLAELGRLTGGRWQAELDRCGSDAGQHVGILYDERRVRANGWYTYASINPHGEACKNQLRPGFGGYLEFPGGLDLHLISVHLKSGPKRRSYELRRRSIEGIAALYSQAQAAETDTDVVIAGDLNTMGCRHCSPKVEAEAEIRGLDGQLRKLGFRRVPGDLGCTEYYKGHGGTLDHFLASIGMRELGSGERASVGGYCAEASCRKLEERHMPAAYDRLSDHCPIVLEVRDSDLD